MKFAIIGCGNIAKKHVYSIQNLANGVLVGVSDIDPHVLKDVSVLWNVPGFDDHQEMIDALEPDVIVVLTSSGSHANIVKSIAHKVKHIIVEKPLALTIKDSEEIIKLCKKNSVSLTVVKQNRFNAPITLTKKLLDEGQLGEIFLGSIRMRWSRSQEYYEAAAWRGTWKHDGGALANQGIHFIDMLQWLMGDVESVFARAANALIKIEAEDTIVVVVKFTSGALATIEITTATRPKDIEGSISILGRYGSVVVGGFAMNQLEYLQTESGQTIDTFPDYKMNSSEFAFAHQEFYKIYTDPNHPQYSDIADGTEALKSIEIIHAIYQSVELEREVRLDESLASRLGV
jgi:UDP-N-acetyl-2-amino-2-deoxyglucuronate dehydrogenase